jgi:putative membrane protein
MNYDNLLVVCIDRDGDIQSKLGLMGPIEGRKKVFDTAVRLGLADPTESDTNALFEAVRLFDELKEKGHNVSVAALVGSENIGYESDSIISWQLDDILSRTPSDGIIVVTDGAEDEYVLPIVQSRGNVISVKRVIVKQSEGLESTYMIIQDFLKQIVNDPKLARLLIGVPGIAAILYMILGTQGWRLIVGVVGVFLAIKGFALEEEVEKAYAELKDAFIDGKISFFTYLVAGIIGAVGIASGYNAISGMGVAANDLNTAIPLFLSGSVDLLAFSVIVALIGKVIDALLEKKKLSKYLVTGVFVFALWIIIDAVSKFLLGTISSIILGFSVALGLIMSMFAFLSIRSLKNPEPLAAEDSDKAVQ